MWISTRRVLITLLFCALPACDGLILPWDVAAGTGTGGVTTTASRRRSTSTTRNAALHLRRLGSHPNDEGEAATTRLQESSLSSCHCRGTPPVIGVFSQPIKSKVAQVYNGTTSTSTSPAPPSTSTSATSSYHYIAASYIKWLEAGGARTIALPYDASPAELDQLFEQIHMVFLPGGDALLSPSVRYMLSKVHDSNHNGNAFPLWGTCLGMEFLLSHFGQDGAPLAENFDAENMSLPLLNVVPDIPSSPTQQHQHRTRSLYGDPTVYKIVTTQAVTLNNHKKGMSPQTFESNHNLTDLWRITSTNVDRQNQSFVSTIEPLHPNTYPYYGVQYHPEKNMFEYAYYDGTTIPFEVIAHHPDATEFSFRTAKFVVELAHQTRLRRCARRTCCQRDDGVGSDRHSNRNEYRHEYTDPVNYPPMYKYPTRSGINFEQVFLIPPASTSLVDEERKAADESYGAASQRISSRGAGADPDRHHHYPYRGPLDGRSSVMQW